MRPVQDPSQSTTTSAPIVQVPVFSTPDICSEVRTRNPVVESDDEPRCVFAKNLLHDVALGEITLNLLERELLELRDFVLRIRSAPTRGGYSLYPNLVGQSIDGFR